MGLVNQKGSVQTGLPNDKYLKGHDVIVWDSQKPMECCRECGHDKCFCTCEPKDNGRYVGLRRNG